MRTVLASGNVLFDAPDDAPHNEASVHRRPGDGGRPAAVRGGLPDADTVTASGSVVYWTAPKGGTLGSPFGTLPGNKRDALTTNRNLRTLERDPRRRLTGPQRAGTSAR